MGDIGKAKEAVKEATAVREKEEDSYQAEKSESEQCIGALEAAINVLSGVGTGKKGFLETFQEAQLLSVVAGVKDVLTMPRATSGMSEQDLAEMKRFVDKPEAFVGKGKPLSAVQTANKNPFGDYAPQSTAIQGILKGMYDSFTADLE